MNETQWVESLRKFIDKIRTIDRINPNEEDMESLRKAFQFVRMWERGRGETLTRELSGNGNEVDALRLHFESEEFQLHSKLAWDVNRLMAEMASRFGVRFADLKEQFGCRDESPDWFQLAIGARCCPKEDDLPKTEKLILEYMRNGYGIRRTTKEICEKIPVNEKAISKALKVLKNRGVLKRSPPQKGPWYLPEDDEPGGK